MQESFLKASTAATPQTGSSGSAGAAITFEPAKLLEIQQTYLQDAAQLWNQSVQAGAAIPADRKSTRLNSSHRP